MSDEWTRDQLEQELRSAAYVLDRLTTEVLLPYTYSDSRPIPVQTERRLDQANDIVRRVNEGLPPEELTEEKMQRAHESLVLAFDQRENRERIAELEDWVRDAPHHPGCSGATPGVRCRCGRDDLAVSP